WGSRDGELVVCHDPDISRTSNGTGTVEALDWSTIASFDAGSWFAPEWTGVPVCRFQDILREFAGRIEMNIHVKAPGADGWVIRKIRDLVADFGVTKHIYLAGHRDVLAWARELAPDIARCCLDELQNLTIVQHAIAYDCQRVQFFDPYYTEALIQEAHSHGMICNFFFADTAQHATELYHQGIDAVLTNFANRVLPVVRAERATQ
ncbi:MAG TPA: glycerophosphodiester phosphodiesterase family protein, partial [Armatimonadota bacterium]|nr:glycerophosphodiester phosphodiesterase family protein [Armatimonadota bacterium]